jgi:hypothetical protein
MICLVPHVRMLSRQHSLETVFVQIPSSFPITLWALKIWMNSLSHGLALLRKAPSALRCTRHTQTHQQQFGSLRHVSTCNYTHSLIAREERGDRRLEKTAQRGASWLVGYSSNNKQKQTPWSESASELYRPSDRRLSAKRLPTFADKGCHVVIVTDPYGRILGFLDRSRYFSIK